MAEDESSIAEFIAALRSADAALAAIRERVADADVTDDAFGKLFEAHEVRDAYRERHPAITRDLDEARGVIAHLVDGLAGQPGAQLPAQRGGGRS